MFTIDKLNEATADFQKYIEPQLYDSGMFDPKDSYVIVCEGDSDDLKTKMDRYAGIDMCTVDSVNQIVQGIASRVQRGTCWRTFTIRTITDNGSFDTELKKRSRAIANGDMYPTWTIQGYISPDDDDPSKIKCTVGIVRTVDLFKYIQNELSNAGFTNQKEFFNALQCWSCIEELGVKKNYFGGIFLSCDWDKMLQRGYVVNILQGVFDS